MSKRICDNCEVEKEKGKRLCYNINCPESKPYKDKIKKEKKEKKEEIRLKNAEKKEKIRIEKEEIRLKKRKEKEKKIIRNTVLNLIKEIVRLKKASKKSFDNNSKKLKRQWENILRAPKAGTNAKGRDGSTRHGLVISYGKDHGYNPTPTDLHYRNKLLKIDRNKCFWCKIKNKECGDHAHPCCNTTHHEYSFSNVLNIVPSCNACNSKKGGKRLEQWISELPEVIDEKGELQWSNDDKDIYREWLSENKEKLLFNDKDVEWLELQFVEINNFHSNLEHCAKHKLNISDFNN